MRRCLLEQLEDRCTPSNVPLSQAEVLATGYVLNPNNDPVVGATVTLLDGNTRQVVANGTTDAIGRYVLPALNPNDYSYQVETVSYDPFTNAPTYDYTTESYTTPTYYIDVSSPGYYSTEEMVNADTSQYPVSVNGGIQTLALNYTPSPGTFQVLTYGLAGDKPLLGNWTTQATGPEVGVFRSLPNGTGEFILNSTGNGSYSPADEVIPYGLATDKPVVGDWLGQGLDSVGVFRALPDGTGEFILHTTSGNSYSPGDEVIHFGLSSDIPVIGDWNSDGTDKVGVFRDGVFVLDTQGLRQYVPGSSSVFTFGSAGDTPIAADWNLSGTSKVGVTTTGAQIVLDRNGLQAYQFGNSEVLHFGLPGDVPLAMTALDGAFVRFGSYRAVGNVGVFSLSDNIVALN